jgi:hypothetical protein
MITSKNLPNSNDNTVKNTAEVVGIRQITTGVMFIDYTINKKAVADDSEISNVPQPSISIPFAEVQQQSWYADYIAFIKSKIN